MRPCLVSGPSPRSPVSSMLRPTAPLLVLCLGVLLTVPGALSAQASPLVPLGDPGYDDLDALLARGMGGEVILTQRPYSRMTFARVARHARQVLEAGPSSDAPAPGNRLREALERLEERFDRELGILCGEASCPEPEPYAQLRSIATDLTLADSPDRTVPTGYSSRGSLIDAAVNPLLQRNGGRRLGDGWTLGAEAQVDLGMGRYVSGQVRPRAGVLEGAEGDTDDQVTLLAGYLRTVVGKVALDLGRNQVTHGFSQELGPALSSNVRGLTMVRLYNERPGRLPWILSGLGPVAFGATVVGMGENRDTPGSVASLLEASIRPHPNLELGALFMSHQAGEGAPEARWWERVRDAIPFLLSRRGLAIDSPEPPISDKVFGLEAHLRVPDEGLEFYAELASTDDHNLFEAPKQAFWHEAVWTWGTRITGVGAEERFDLWAEATHSGVRPYTHHQFTSGLTVDGRILGSPLGPLANSVRGGVDWTGADHRISWQVAREQYEPDRWANVGFDGSSSTWNWERVEDNPDEVRLRSTVRWSRAPTLTGLRTELRVGVERVTRFDFGEADRTNALAQLRLEYRW